MVSLNQLKGQVHASLRAMDATCGSAWCGSMEKNAGPSTNPQPNKNASHMIFAILYNNCIAVHYYTSYPSVFMAAVPYQVASI